MQQLEIDGIPVFWEQGREPLSAGIRFAVGRRDESIGEIGITRLVERLVMRSLPKSHLDRRSWSSRKETQFAATGSPEAVAEFLQQVCESISFLSAEHLATEASVLTSELAATGGVDLLDFQLLRRYGAAGVGLAGLAPPGLDRIPPQRVLEHAARWFVSGNAAVWLTGLPPDGLRLPLPSGVRPPKATQTRLAHRYPTQDRYTSAFVAFSFEVPSSDTAMLGIWILLRRMTERLRHSSGVSHHLDFLTLVLSDWTAHVSFQAGARQGSERAVVEGMYEELVRMFREGPTVDELAYEVAAYAEYFDDPRTPEENLDAIVDRYFEGAELRDSAKRLRLLKVATPNDVVRALAPAMKTLLVLVPEEAPPVLAGVPELGPLAGAPSGGRTWRRSRHADVPRGTRLVSAPGGIALVADRRASGVRYQDLAAVGVVEADHHHLELLGLDGLTLSVCEQAWRGGPALVTEVARATADLPRYAITSDPH
ncbi:MAG: hypothetical protein LC789_12695 [Actinobacteria bacterium]|nr:hypothetical protein [Actinomycetota bacterium]